MIFKESQKFTQPFVWLFLIVLTGVALFATYKQLVLNEPFGNNPAPDAVLFLFPFPTISLMILFLILKLETKLDKTGLEFGFAPFFKKHLAWNAIEDVQLVDYGFIGGWGIRYSSKYGTVYNVKGRYGLAIRTKKGKKMLIGTQKPEEIRSFLLTIQHGQLA